MKPSVRQVENGEVLRLFPSEKDASKVAVEISCGDLERFEAILHESQNGWLVVD